MNRKVCRTGGKSRDTVSTDCKSAFSLPVEKLKNRIRSNFIGSDAILVGHEEPASGGLRIITSLFVSRLMESSVHSPAPRIIPSGERLTPEESYEASVRDSSGIHISTRSSMGVRNFVGRGVRLQFLIDFDPSRSLLKDVEFRGILDEAS